MEVATIHHLKNGPPKGVVKAQQAYLAFSIFPLNIFDYHKIVFETEHVGGAWPCPMPFDPLSAMMPATRAIVPKKRLVKSCLDDIMN